METSLSGELALPGTGKFPLHADAGGLIPINCETKIAPGIPLFIRDMQLGEKLRLTGELFVPGCAPEEGALVFGDGAEPVVEGFQVAFSERPVRFASDQFNLKEGKLGGSAVGEIEGLFAFESPLEFGAEGGVPYWVVDTGFSSLEQGTPLGRSGLLAESFEGGIGWDYRPEFDGIGGITDPGGGLNLCGKLTLAGGGIDDLRGEFVLSEERGEIIANGRLWLDGRRSSCHAIGEQVAGPDGGISGSLPAEFNLRSGGQELLNLTGGLELRAAPGAEPLLRFPAGTALRLGQEIAGAGALDIGRDPAALDAHLALSRVQRSARIAGGDIQLSGEFDLRHAGELLFSLEPLSADLGFEMRGSSRIDLVCASWLGGEKVPLLIGTGGGLMLVTFPPFSSGCEIRLRPSPPGQLGASTMEFEL